MSEAERLIDFGDDRLDATQKAVRSAGFLELLETGQPVSLEEIARHAGTPEQTTREVLKEMTGRGSAQLDDKGHLTGIAGLSVTPTRHSIALSRGERWTWCALDAIGIVGALGSGAIISQAPGGTVNLALDNGVFHPEGTAILIVDGYGMTSSLAQWCPLVDFFPDGASADLWAQKNGVAGRGVVVARLTSVAANRWRAIIESR